MRFPENFLWGTATAAYQVEGAVIGSGRGMVCVVGSGDQCRLRA
jgi:beta-glucosidase/6-phospho-beta-glucosidase/beta-galactosidase